MALRQYLTDAVVRDPLRRLTGKFRDAPGQAELALVPYRSRGADAAVVFIHGFGSNQNPFGRFAELLVGEPQLEGWDLFGLSYNTGFLPDLRGVWSADPSVALLGTYLSSRANLKPLDEYGALALIAHSMGGLVVQQALVIDDELADRVSHVICFGTPSGGVPAARWGGFLKQQVGDMVENGQFIRGLRQSWTTRFGRSRPFELLAIAGDRDAFVPAESSLLPFPPETRVVVPGNHIEIVSLEGPGSMSEQVVVEGLVGDAAPGGPWNSARVAVEQHEFDRAVRQMLPRAEELDERHLVYLALALEGTGRQAEALELLEDQANKHGTDATGAIAGRLKRMWMAGGGRADGDSALELYRSGLEAAQAEGDPEQAYYHAINVAFLEYTYRRDKAAAAAAAETALRHCEAAPPGFWRSATEAEARIYLDDWQAALAAYADAVAFEPTVRELDSAYTQAFGIASVCGPKDLRDGIDRLFRDGSAGKSG